MSTLADELATEYQETLLYNKSLAEYTTWHADESAAKLYKPAHRADLLLRHLPASEPLLWLGLGSNSLIKDSGFSGTVILTQGCIKEISLLDAQTAKIAAGVREVHIIGDC